MKCKNVVEELSEYLNGELDSGMLADLEVHLANCKNCRLVVNTCKKTVEIFCNSEPVPLPEDTRDRLHKALFSKIRKPHN